MGRLEALMALHARTPGDVDLAFMIASEHANAGRPAEALPWLQAYVAEGRDVGAGYALMAECLVKLDRTDDAREALRQGADAARRAGHPTLAAELLARGNDLDD